MCVPNRKGETLLPIIQERVVPGTVICSDEFSTYKKLTSLGYDHRTVNHSDEEYVRLDPDSVSVTTNGIEGFWGNFKIALRNRRGTRRHNLEQFARVRSWRSLNETIFAVVAQLTSDSRTD
jgi:transposase-like protein